MKKVFLMLFAWLVLFISVASVFEFAKSLDPKIKVPKIVSISNENNDVVLKWLPVEYATIYSIHRKSGPDDWEFVKSVSSSKCAYTDIGAANGAYQYAVRACNVSLGVYHWSRFSTAVAVS